MSRKELFKRINQLCIKLDDSYDINCGGCCYVAACLAEQLTLYSIPYEVIHYDLWGCHYAIKVSDRYLNRADYKKREIIGIYEWTPERLFEEYYEESWNHRYNRRYNSTVKRAIIKVFKEYENSRA